MLLKFSNIRFSTLYDNIFRRNLRELFFCFQFYFIANYTIFLRYLMDVIEIYTSSWKGHRKSMQRIPNQTLYCNVGYFKFPIHSCIYLYLSVCLFIKSICFDDSKKSWTNNLWSLQSKFWNDLINESRASMLL